MNALHFIQNNVVDNAQENRDLQTKRYINSKNLAELKFSNMNNDINKRIDEEIVQREDSSRESQIEENRFK